MQKNIPVILIAAIGNNHELGRNNDLLWRLKSDMNFFKTTTTGHWVLMGRKSWESLPPKFRPLPNRVNCVITRNAELITDGAQVFSDLISAIRQSRVSGAECIFIIGGAQIYSQAVRENLMDEMYLTHVDASFPDADVFFPFIEEKQWIIREISSFTADEHNEFSGKILHYTKK